jgi:enoyl-CoA hydratase
VKSGDADHVFRVPGDVAGTVAGPLQRRENEKVARCGGYEIRIGCHLFLEKAYAALVQPVDLRVARDHGRGKVVVALGIRSHRVEQHLVRDADDTIDLHSLRSQHLVGKFDSVLRDLDGIVADPFQIRRDVQHRGDLAQFSGNGLLTPDQLDALGVDLAAKVVQDVIPRDDARARGDVASVEGLRGKSERICSECAETDDVEARPLQRFVIGCPHSASIRQGALHRNGEKRVDMSDHYENIIGERDGALAIVTLNRPAVLNALNAALLGELSRALETLDGDHSVRAVIITGAGEKAFAAGADIGELAVLPSRAAAKAAAQYGQAITRRIERLRVPVIAAINGFALGGGCELALACDIRIASETAKLGQPEVNLGIMPGYGGSQRTARLLGRSMAFYLCLTGEIVDAKEALRIGLVDRVVPPSELMAETRRVAEAIASKAPLAITACKRAIDRGIHLSIDDALELEATEFAALVGTADFKEGASAFFEKRKPAFTGK